MQSKLFQKFADLPILNWFNHSEKMTYKTDRVDVSMNGKSSDRGDRSYSGIVRQNERYFQHIRVQDQYIKTMHGLINKFDMVVAEWDLIQAKHEDELENSKLGPMRKVIADREKTIYEQQRTIHELEKKSLQRPIITEKELVKLIERLDDLQYHFSGASKIEQRARKTNNLLIEYANKLKSHMDNQKIV